MTSSRLAPTSGTPSLLRSMNDRAVLEVINAAAPISRAQIARECGRSKPTVSLALSRLVHAGVVREVGRSAGSKGATAVLYEIDAKAGTVVGLDVGRGWLRQRQQLTFRVRRWFRPNDGRAHGRHMHFLTG